MRRRMIDSRRARDSDAALSDIPLAPILLMLGPSGVGKSCVSTRLTNQRSFLHFDIDKNHGFQANGFPAQWDNDIGNINFAELANIVRDRLLAEGRHAAVVSFPTVHVLNMKQLKSAADAGILPVVLWGTETHCINARRARAKKNRVRFDLERYKRKNRRTFETYARSEYAPFRIETFQPDGSRWPLEKTLATIIARTSG